MEDLGPQFEFEPGPTLRAESGTEVCRQSEVVVGDRSPTAGPNPQPELKIAPLALDRTLLSASPSWQAGASSGRRGTGPVML
jgi:hypothetical protein